MGVSAALVYFVGGMLLLYVGGESLVSGAVSVVRRTGISPLMIGLTVVAFATSAPELAVSLSAALDGHHGLALGNVVGSNICNLALVLGLTFLFSPSAPRGRFLRRDVPVMIASTVLVLFMLVDDSLSRTDGGVMLTVLAMYLVLKVRYAREERAYVLGLLADRGTVLSRRSLAMSAVLLLAGLALLVLGGDLLVTGGVAIAALAGVPPAVVGLSVAALGTSLPELATALVAAGRGYSDMAVGSLVGSSIFNLLSILGLTSLVIPLSRGAVTDVDLAVLFVVTIVVYLVMRIGPRIERWEAGILLLMYAGYLSWLLSESTSRLAIAPG